MTWKATHLALGVVVALAPSCRQVAGIRVLQSQQEECSACVDGSCASQVSACLPTASCASRLDCALACDPSNATCEPACEVQPVGDADDLGVVNACIAKSCSATCGLSCGGVLPVIPPSSASACAACVAAQCCTATQACAESVDCSRAVECARSQSTPDALAGCEVVRYPAGAALYSTMATCVQGACAEACAIGSDWACVGKVSWPKPTSDEISGTLTVVNAAVQSEGVAGLSVSSCFTDDVGCTTPVSPALTTDANGQVVITVPTTDQAGLVGFVGYLQITDPTGTYLPALVFGGFPRTQTGYSTTILIVTESLAMSIAAVARQTFDPTSPIIIVSVADCAGIFGANATFSVAPSGPATEVVYTRNGVPDLSATSTNADGTAIIANAPPGQITIATRVAGVTTGVASTPILTRAGTVTLVLVTPTP